MVSTNTIQLTPFEEQVLQACGRFAARYYEVPFFSSGIEWQGRYLFGSPWAGFRQYPKTGHEFYPAINAAFGRLRRKGLVYRVHDHPHCQDAQMSCGIWSLTDHGRCLLGLS